jgi:hypothetical protein
MLPPHLDIIISLSKSTVLLKQQFFSHPFIHLTAVHVSKQFFLPSSIHLHAVHMSFPQVRPSRLHVLGDSELL